MEEVLIAAAFLGAVLGMLVGGLLGIRDSKEEMHALVDHIYNLCSDKADLQDDIEEKDRLIAHLQNILIRKSEQEKNNMGHGHVTPNADGSVARCGGPGLCAVCTKELMWKNAEEKYRRDPVEVMCSQLEAPGQPAKLLTEPENWEGAGV
jgi:hypothetical protein